MKFSVLLTISLLAIAFGAPAEKSQERRVNGENGWYVPQIDGSFEWVYKEEVSALEELVREDNLPDVVGSPVNFYLHTQFNPNKPELIESTHESIEESHFNKDHPTRFVIHGWREDYTAKLNSLVRDAWLSRGEYNIIVVDWSYYASSIIYSRSKNKVGIVGGVVAGMIDFLHAEFGMSLDTLLLIGHSLGAHVCGFAGKNVAMGRVDTIIALDPASPLFEYDNPENRLSAADANYVESIHTNGGMLGFLKPIGRSAFYPNGGISQPGCGFDAFQICAHSRSYIYYAEAVRQNTFPAVKCENYTQATTNDCGATYSSVRMGAPSNVYMASGHFFVPVNRESPFGKGV